MSENITIRTGPNPEDAHTVTAKPITLICHQGLFNISVDNTIKITPVTTLDFVRNLTEADFEVLKTIPDQTNFYEFCFRTVFKDEIKYPTTLNELRRQGDGIKHVFGLVVLLLTAISTKKTPHLQLPETYLHPRYQCNLADLFIFLQNPGNQILNMLSQ